MEMSEYALMDMAEDGMWWYRALHARLLDQLAGVRGSVLDAGCGTGGFLAKLRQRRSSIRAYGCEWADGAARRAAAKSGAMIVRGTLVALPFADASFDAVVAADVLCHAAVQPELALAELARVLRPSGRIVVNMPAFGWLFSAHDRRVHNVRRVTAGWLRANMEAAGFGDTRAIYWNGLLLPLMVARRRLTARGHDGRSDVRLLPAWLDTALYGMTALERLAPLSLPAGGSVMATALRLSDRK